MGGESIHRYLTANGTKCALIKVMSAFVLQMRIGAHKVHLNGDGRNNNAKYLVCNCNGSITGIELD